MTPDNSSDISIRLFETFSDIFFDEETHSYQDSSGYQYQISVTRWINQFCKEFDSKAVAEKCAKKRGVLVEDLLREWEEEGNYSCTLGTAIHSCIENLWYRKNFNPDFSKHIYKDKNIQSDFETRKNKCKIIYEKLKTRFVPIKNEFIVYDKPLGLVGTIDFLAWDKKANSYAILDWKTSKSITTVPNQWTIKMKAPFDKYWDLNFYHYSLQLSCYKYILEKNVPGMKIDNMYLIHIPKDDESPKSYHCVDMTEDIEHFFKSN